ncbi:MAG: YhbY family RNA-binding protein [Deltaproteobacteria bacterium]|nr:MAG: YhbY family RNA-binding protein [Deltaproteobacteria bacterium]
MASPLSSRARSYLRGLAHHLEPVVQVGAAGLTDAVARAVTIALEDHELVKVQLPKGLAPRERAQLAADLAAKTDSHLVHRIGRRIVLYRARRRDDPHRPRIELPG